MKIYSSKRIRLSLFSIWYQLWRDFKDLNRSTVADKVLRDKAFNIAKNTKYEGYQRGLAPIVYNFLTKRLLVEQFKMKLCLIND